jgi:glutamate carboxypeptidase
VPDLAIGRFNVRVAEISEIERATDAINAAAREVGKRDGIAVAVHGTFNSPPKMVDARSKNLIEAVRACAADVGLGDLKVISSGGASDGNKLSAAGMAVIDTLGPVGGEIHSDREYVKLPTIAERAKVVSLLLTRMASGSLQI